MVGPFIRGMTSYGTAFQLISRYRLWGYVLVPALVSFAYGIGLLLLAWTFSDDLGRWMVSIYPWEKGRSAVTAVATVLGALAILALGFIVYKNLVMALASPFMSPLSEKIERELRGYSRPVTFSTGQFFSDLWRGLRIGLRNLLRELFFTLLLFLLGLIPVLSPFVAAGLFLIQAFYAGFGNMDYTLERHLDVRESVRFVRRHRALALGNGVVFMALLLTLIGFLFALPLGAVAATLETVRLLPKEEVDGD
jgi:CysZ protein